jgi:hypothetical protein
MFEELQERISLARLNDITSIKVEVKVLEALLESVDRTKVTVDLEYRQGPSENQVTEMQETLLKSLSAAGDNDE